MFLKNAKNTIFDIFWACFSNFWPKENSPQNFAITKILLSKKTYEQILSNTDFRWTHTLTHACTNRKV